VEQPVGTDDRQQHPDAARRRPAQERPGVGLVGHRQVGRDRAGAERLGQRLQVLCDAGSALGGEGSAPLRSLGAQGPAQRPLGLLDGVLVLAHARNLARAHETGIVARHGGECPDRPGGLHPLGGPRPTTGAQHPMDYGHELEFGVFITPTNQPPEQPVLLAQLAERVGFDLATFQDHPYQPAFHDTWTLLTWVAASTERIRIAPNVLNVPLRQPAVVARSAASLDLLSSGRLELGLGAGGFWDAIEAMGGTRLTPGESVDALSEGIDVIRAVWDTSTRERLVLDGEHHRLAGAKRGPAPAHDIGIWVGAYKPRMLRLVGRKADGWLPSLAYLGSLQALADGNAVIDEAAAEAGRDPRAIR